MAASPSACSCSRSCPPLGRQTWTTSTSADSRLARSAMVSAPFSAAHGLLTATSIRLMMIPIFGPGGLSSLPTLLGNQPALAHQFPHRPQGLSAVADAMFFIRRQLGRRATQLTDQEQRIISESVAAAGGSKD